MEEKRIAILAGDGIGPEVMEQALRVLQHMKKQLKFRFTLQEAYIGGAAYDQYGNHFPEQTKKICQQSDAILFGSVGGPLEDSHLPKWEHCEANSLLALRKTFKFNANIRPARVYPELIDACPLKRSIVETGIDLIIIRELIGGIYFGKHEQLEIDGVCYARDVMEYDQGKITAVAHTAFQVAQKREKNLISVDKANVLATSKLWRAMMIEVSQQYPEVKLQHMLIDNCAMQLVINPSQFDVIVTSNMFGDILSDLAAVLPGSLGLMPSASRNSDGFGFYEPSGGSAPTIAGKNSANPIAQILSLAMMFRYSFNLLAEAGMIESAVTKALQAGCRTGDIYSKGMRLVGTKEMTDAIISFL